MEIAVAEMCSWTGRRVGRLTRSHAFDLDVSSLFSCLFCFVCFFNAGLLPYPSVCYPPETTVSRKRLKTPSTTGLSSRQAAAQHTKQRQQHIDGCQQVPPPAMYYVRKRSRALRARYNPQRHRMLLAAMMRKPRRFSDAPSTLVTLGRSPGSAKGCWSL